MYCCVPFVVLHENRPVPGDTCTLSWGLAGLMGAAAEQHQRHQDHKIRLSVAKAGWDSKRIRSTTVPGLPPELAGGSASGQKLFVDFYFGTV